MLFGGVNLSSYCRSKVYTFSFSQPKGAELPMIPSGPISMSSLQRLDEALLTPTNMGDRSPNQRSVLQEIKAETAGNLN